MTEKLGEPVTSKAVGTKKIVGETRMLSDLHNKLIFHFGIVLP